MKRHVLHGILVALACGLWCGCVPTSQPFVCPENYDETIRVACIGDSITYGAGIKDREHNHYPAQLGRLLGPRWDCRNFGVSGATLLRRGDMPYWDESAYREALGFDPHVVIIKLGTNDSKPQNWKYADAFEQDYKDLIRSFAALPSSPRIWICLPAPVYEDRWGIREAVVDDEVLPKVRRIATEMGVGLIDLYKALSSKPEVFPDGIHPNAAGATVMAGEIYGEITGQEAPTLEAAGAAAAP